MITASDFRNGVTFEEDGQVLQVVEFLHVKPGKGAAFVRTKLKNVVTGAVIEKSYNPTAKVQQAFVERKDMEYLYNDGDLYYFMDTETRMLSPTTFVSSRKTPPAKSSPTRVRSSALSLLSSWSLKLPRQSPASKAIPQPT